MKEYNVIIIKNIEQNTKAFDYAEKSYKEKREFFYYMQDNGLDENFIKENKSRFSSRGLVLMIFFKNNTDQTVQDIFIGNKVRIDEKNNVYYQMQVHLSREYHERAMKSLLGKIDLDIAKDFELKRYVIMSDMNSLYDELLERINAKNQRALLAADNIKLQKNSDEDYVKKFREDRESVVSSKAFRRLVDKAQIFSAEKGDYFRTRMTHSLEVNQIAKKIAMALDLNVDLTEAIALGHDLGHTPFGHQGERTLDEILKGEIFVGKIIDEDLLKERCFGGFKHNYQSARILSHLEERYTDTFGLSVSVQVIEGVLKHTKFKKGLKLEDFISASYIELIKCKDGDEQVCATLEGQTVAIADEIAQRGHDVDDALTSGVMSIDEFVDRLKVSKCKKLEETIQKELEGVEHATRLIVDVKSLKITRIVACIVDYLITTTIQYSCENMHKIGENTLFDMNNEKKIVQFAPEVEGINSYLERVVQKRVICNSEVARADYNANVIVKTLFEKYYWNPRLLHEGTIHRIFIETLMHKDLDVSNSAVNLGDGAMQLLSEEIKEMTGAPLDIDTIKKYINGEEVEKEKRKEIIIFEKRKILVRAIVDYIAGMTDGYALEEYNKLE